MRGEEGMPVTRNPSKEERGRQGEEKGARAHTFQEAGESESDKEKE